MPTASTPRSWAATASCSWRSTPGTTVEVPGYSGEPYLRFGDDGVVEENQASAATYLNQSRTRDRSPTATTTPTPSPSGGGRRPTAAGPGTTTASTAWAAASDGPGSTSRSPGTCRSASTARTSSSPATTACVDAPSPLPWLALALVLAIAVALGLGRLLSALPAAGVTLLLAGIGGVVAGMAQRGESPPGAPTSPLVVILPAIAVVAGLIVVIQRGRVLRAIAALAGAAALGGWAVVRIQVLWKAILPTSLSAGTDRLLTAVALGAAAGAAALVVRSGALTPDLEDLDDARDTHRGRRARVNLVLLDQNLTLGAQRLTERADGGPCRTQGTPTRWSSSWRCSRRSEIASSSSGTGSSPSSCCSSPVRSGSGAGRSRT